MVKNLDYLDFSWYMKRIKRDWTKKKINEYCKKFVSNIVVKSRFDGGFLKYLYLNITRKKIIDNNDISIVFLYDANDLKLEPTKQLEPRSRFPSRATRFPHFSFPLAYFHSKSSVHSRVKGRVTRFSIPLQLENYGKFDGPEDMDSRRGFASLLSRELNFFLINFRRKKIKIIWLNVELKNCWDIYR